MKFLSYENKKNKYIEEAIENVIKKLGINSTLKRKEFIIEEIDWMQRFGALVERCIFKYRKIRAKGC